MAKMTTNDQIEELSSRTLTKEEEYYYEESFKQPVESISRIEDMAKIIVGTTGATSGLFLAALRLSMQSKSVPQLSWYIVAPFVCWIISIIFQILVLFPRKYNTRQNQPEAWKLAFIKAGKSKYIMLCIGTFFFIAGIAAGIYAFVK